jgi:hypothetical protein
MKGAAMAKSDKLKGAAERAKALAAKEKGRLEHGAHKAKAIAPERGEAARERITKARQHGGKG